MERFNEALKVFNKSLSYFPKDSVLLHYKSLVLANLGKSKDSLKIVDKFLKKDPHDCEALYIKSINLANKNKFEEAIECIDDALLESDDYRFFIFKSKLLMKLGKLEEALDVISLGDDNIHCLICKLDILNELNDISAALECCDEILEVNSNNMEVLKIKSELLGN